MLPGFMGRRRGKAPSRDKAADRNQRPPPPRPLDSAMENVEGMLIGERSGLSSDKQAVHSEWTKDPFPDDFDDEDLS